MDKLLIELNSVNKLKDVILRTERVHPNISDNDKIPSWDGELIVYSSTILKKDNILGKINVQVKGTFKEDLKEDNIKFLVDIIDLENYRKTDGCIYFVVYMKNFDEFKIYYKILLPYDLKNILDEIPEGQKTKMITFTSYPQNDIDLQIKIFRLYINEKNKQVGTVDASFKLEEMDESKISIMKNGLNFTIYGTDKDMFGSVFKIPTYIYANIVDGKVSIPVHKHIFSEVMTEIKEFVILDGKIYYDTIAIRKTEFEEEIIFGKGFTCSTEKSKVNYCAKGTLSERIKDLEFLLALGKSKNKYLKIGDFFVAEFDSIKFEENIPDIHQQLKNLNTVKGALEAIGVKNDLECDNLSEIDKNHLKILIDGIIMRKLLQFNNMSETIKVYNMGIANILIPTLWTKMGDNFKIESLYDAKEPLVYFDNNEGEKTSIYLQMKVYDFLNISNIKYNVIYNSIISKPYNDKNDMQITFFVLEALKAYDINNSKELLSFILDITEWQISKRDNDINKLNYYQAVKRQREFSEKEIERILRIKNSSKSDDILFGISILLESKIESNMYWGKLDLKRRDELKQYPIYKLWKDNNLI